MKGIEKGIHEQKKIEIKMHTYVCICVYMYCYYIYALQFLHSSKIYDLTNRQHTTFLRNIKINLTKISCMDTADIQKYNCEIQIKKYKNKK